MRSMPGDAPIVVNSAGLRCGAEGLRPPARHARRGRVLGAGARRARVRGAARSTGCDPCAAPGDRSSCRTRATCATCSASHLAGAHRAGHGVRRGRARRRRAVLRRRRCLLGAAARARRPDPRPQAGSIGRASAASGATVVASANPGCAMHLQAAGVHGAPPDAARGPGLGGAGVSGDHDDLADRLDAIVADLDERSFDLLREASAAGRGRPDDDRRADAGPSGRSRRQRTCCAASAATTDRSPGDQSSSRTSSPTAMVPGVHDGGVDAHVLVEVAHHVAQHRAILRERRPTISRVTITQRGHACADLDARRRRWRSGGPPSRTRGGPARRRCRSRSWAGSDGRRWRCRAAHACSERSAEVRHDHQRERIEVRAGRRLELDDHRREDREVGERLVVLATEDRRAARPSMSSLSAAPRR